MNKIDKMIININYVDDYLKFEKYLSLCPPTCSACCHDYFYVSLPEFYLTLYGLLQLPTNLDFYYQKALKTYTHFSDRYETELKRLLPNASARLESVVIDFSEGEYVNYQNLPECVMLNNGRCSIYKYRPNTCRKYGTTVSCELIENVDYQEDEETNYHLYPLFENTRLVDESYGLVETHKYPLWFLYAYFMRPEFRNYVLDNLDTMLSVSDKVFANTIKGYD